MRKMIDAVSGGELWMEITASLTVYHIDELDEDGNVEKRTSFSDSAKAKSLWQRVRSRATAGVPEKGVPA